MRLGSPARESIAGFAVDRWGGQHNEADCSRTTIVRTNVKIVKMAGAFVFTPGNSSRPMSLCVNKRQEYYFWGTTSEDKDKSSVVLLLMHPRPIALKMWLFQPANAWRCLLVIVISLSMQYKLTRPCKSSPNVSLQELQERQRAGRLKSEKRSVSAHKGWETRKRNQALREQPEREARELLEPRPHVPEAGVDDSPRQVEAIDNRPEAGSSPKSDGQDRAIDGNERPGPLEGASDRPNRHQSNEQSPAPPDLGAGPPPAESDNPLPEQHEPGREPLAQEVLPRALVSAIQCITAHRSAIPKIEEKIQRLLPEFRIRNRAYFAAAS